MFRVLFAASEAYPLIKTGGLGDVAGALPPALKALDCDLRLVLPAYREALARAPSPRPLLSLPVPGLADPVTLIQTRLPGTRVRTWLVDYPPAFDRPGNPYVDARHRPWPDNAARFALFGRVLARLAGGVAELDWAPQILHCHDWQTGLAPALLAGVQHRPATVFTIHNLAYQGLFPHDTFRALQLPAELWSPEAMEFYGQFSFIKGGLVFADHLTTVSPTYAREIQTPEFGHGLDGLLRHRRQVLTGILNGIDERTWNPGTDRHLAQTYNRRGFRGKRANKRALQEECGLPPDPDTPLIGLISRLVYQKGIDVVIEALPRLLQTGAQLVFLGSGEPRFEQALRYAAAQHPDQVYSFIGYDEGLAHRIEGGADMFLMPSRFEPCGLNQLYSLRYGTVPIVHRVGGLADSVTDADPARIAAGQATGIVFEDLSPDTLSGAVQRALALYRQPQVWTRIAITGMGQHFGWQDSARRYLDLYHMLRQRRA